MNTQSIGLRYFLMLLTALVINGCGDGVNEKQPVPEAPAIITEPELPAHDLTSLLAGESRAETDRVRDAGRKPADVIAFLGIEPGMNVIDVIAAGGYYTEVLSLAVGPEGHVAAQNPAFVLEIRDGVNEKALSARLADERLGNVSRLDKEVDEISPDDGPFDAAITALNFHDIYYNRGEEGAVKMMRVIYAAMKPGGVFGIIDHHGAQGNDNKALHRALKKDAIRTAEAAGFVLEGESGLLHMHGDDMTQSVFTEGLRGKTHRFLLKLRKPEG